jgi:hypothetical protein
LNHKHVVLVCATNLEHDFLNHFLLEFYGHQRHQVGYKHIFKFKYSIFSYLKAIHTVLLSSKELNSEVTYLLHSPLWYKKVYFILGTALRDRDLQRVELLLKIL